MAMVARPRAPAIPAWGRLTGLRRPPGLAARTAWAATRRAGPRFPRRAGEPMARKANGEGAGLLGVTAVTAVTAVTTGRTSTPRGGFAGTRGGFAGTRGSGSSATDG